MGESAYSFSLTTFSPSGKLVQIEYALNAVNAGATSLGIRATNGVVLATEKKLPSILVRCGAGSCQGCCALRPHEVVLGLGWEVRWLPGTACQQAHYLPPMACRPCQVDESTVQKISLLTPNTGMTYSGMGPDSRVLVRLRASCFLPRWHLLHRTWHSCWMGSWCSGCEHLDARGQPFPCSASLAFPPLLLIYPLGRCARHARAGRCTSVSTTSRYQWRSCAERRRR